MFENSKFIDLDIIIYPFIPDLIVCGNNKKYQRETLRNLNIKHLFWDYDEENKAKKQV